jgi:hypothetical protein
LMTRSENLQLEHLINFDDKNKYEANRVSTSGVIPNTRVTNEYR